MRLTPVIDATSATALFPIQSARRPTPKPKELPIRPRGLVNTRPADEPSTAIWSVGKFLVLAKLGRGGMAEVHLALARYPNGVKKLVALKLLRPELAGDSQFVEMFRNEARLAALLNHPHVVSTYEVSDEGAQLGIVMEYLEGQTLASMERALRKEGSSLTLRLRILADCLRALHYAHELKGHERQGLGIVHRDVSPQNVLVTYDGVVKLLDFGIAKAVTSVANTQAGTLKGKARYMAPERLSGHEADRRSDLFSVGIMLWQALTGNSPWEGQSDVSVIQSLATGKAIPRPRAVNMGVHPTLDAICQKALAYDPAARYQSAEEFQDAIEDFLTSHGTLLTERGIAKFMNRHFGRVRAEFQRVVDAQLSVAANLPGDTLADVSPNGAGAISDGLPFLTPWSSSSIPIYTTGTDILRASSTPPSDTLVPPIQMLGDAPSHPATELTLSRTVAAVFLVLAVGGVGGTILARTSRLRGAEGSPSDAGGEVASALPPTPYFGLPPAEVILAREVEMAVPEAAPSASASAPDKAMEAPVPATKHRRDHSVTSRAPAPPPPVVQPESEAKPEPEAPERPLPGLEKTGEDERSLRQSLDLVR